MGSVSEDGLFSAMNKILPIMLVVVLSGCASNKSHMMYIEKWENIFDSAYEKCRTDESKMVGYVHCFHKAEKEIRKRQMADLPWNMSENHFYNHDYLYQLRILKRAKRYHLVIAEEVDAGRASRALGELEMQRVIQLLHDETRLAVQKAQDSQFTKQLQFLDIYSKAIERTTPKAPQTIIVPKY